MNYNAGMNDQVRQSVREVMQERGITQTALAEQLGVFRPNLNRVLNGQSGNIPKMWSDVLDVLELDVVAVKRGG